VRVSTAAAGVVVAILVVDAVQQRLFFALQAKSESQTRGAAQGRQASVSDTHRGWPHSQQTSTHRH